MCQIVSVSLREFSIAEIYAYRKVLIGITLGNSLQVLVIIQKNLILKTHFHT